MRGGRTLAAAVTIAAFATAAGPHRTPPGPDAEAGQGAPGVVSENPGAQPSERTCAQDGPGIDPGNTQFYSPRGVAPLGETVTRGTADPVVGTPGGGKRNIPNGG